MINYTTSRNEQTPSTEQKLETITFWMITGNNQIFFNLIRLQSEVSTIHDKADDSPTFLGEQESMIKEVELRTAKNQIQLELMGDFCYGEGQESCHHINDELVQLDKDITITNQYERRQNIIKRMCIPINL